MFGLGWILSKSRAKLFQLGIKWQKSHILGVSKNSFFKNNEKQVQFHQNSTIL